MKSNPHFFIFGYFGWYNLGDDAIGLSIIKKLKDHYPDSTFTITCNNKYFLDNINKLSNSKDFRIIKINILEIIQSILKSDYFIIAGGTHFHDEDQLKLRRFKILLYFVILTTFSRSVSKSPFLFSHGIGPITTSWARLLIQIILSNSNKIFVRDIDSYNLVSLLGYNNNCIHGFDCTATLIEENLDIGSYSTNPRNQKIIGISLIPFYEIYTNNNKNDLEIVRSLSICLDSILKQDKDIKLNLFAFRSGSKHSDVPILEALMKNINYSRDAINIFHYAGDIDIFLKLISDCDFFIGMRYHASLFAYLFNKPQIILDYMGKCNSLGRDIAINPNAIVSINEIWTLGFCDKIQSLLINPDQFIANLHVDSAIMRANKMFDNLGEYL